MCGNIFPNKGEHKKKIFPIERSRLINNKSKEYNPRESHSSILYLNCRIIRNHVPYYAAGADSGLNLCSCI